MSIRIGKVFYVYWLFFGVFVAYRFALLERMGLIGAMMI